MNGPTSLEARASRVFTVAVPVTVEAMVFETLQAATPEEAAILAYERVRVEKSIKTVVTTSRIESMTLPPGPTGLEVWMTEEGSKPSLSLLSPYLTPTRHGGCGVV